MGKLEIAKEYSEAVRLAYYPDDNAMRKLFKEYNKTSSNAAFNTIVTGFQKIILDICKEFSDRIQNPGCSLEMMDLIQQANYCLVKDIQRKIYDVNSPVKPTTYFYTTISNGVKNYLNENSNEFSTSAYENRKIQSVKQYHLDIKEGMQEAKALKKNKISKKDLIKYAPRPTVSIYKQLDESDEDSEKLIDVIAPEYESHDSDTEKIILENDFHNILKRNLTAIEYEIFIDRFEYEFSTQEIAYKNNISTEEVSKLIKTAKNKLKEVPELQQYK